MNTDEYSYPFYKQWKFYLLSLAGLAGLVFLLLLFSVITLRWVNPSFTSFTLQEDWTRYETERYNLSEWWVPYDEIPEHLKWAVVASEDQLFWEHNGFDIESIQEAWQDRQAGRRYRGASSISQQVAKNLYLSPAQTYIRKGIEAGITVLIEVFWPKERILEVYLNISEFGPGIYGIGKAADTFWGTGVSGITPEISARLAAVLPSPKRMRVEPPSPFTEERSLWVLRQMTHLSGIAYYEVPEEEGDDPLNDIDPLLLEAELQVDELLLTSEKDSVPPDTTANDTIEDQLMEMDLPDSLLRIPGPDTTGAKPDSIDLQPIQ